MDDDEKEFFSIVGTSNFICKKQLSISLLLSQDDLKNFNEVIVPCGFMINDSFSDENIQCNYCDRYITKCDCGNGINEVPHLKNKNIAVCIPQICKKGKGVKGET